MQKIFKLISSNEENSGDLSSALAAISRNYQALEPDRRKMFALELKKFGKLFYYLSAVYNVWNSDMEQLAVVFNILYNVLYERDVTPDIDPAELVDLVEYSTKLAREECAIALTSEDGGHDQLRDGQARSARA